MTGFKIYNIAVCRIFVLLSIFFFTEQDVFCQKDSLVLHCQKIKPGMTVTEVDSLMPFYIGKMHRSAGGSWRNMYDSIYQTVEGYQDKNWNEYTFRMLFNKNRLIYFDLHFYKAQEIFYSAMDTVKINEIVSVFNEQYNASDNFASILSSFHTVVYNLDSVLLDFFSNATIKDKQRLLTYSKSICPEYAASAIIRLLELEKAEPFLTQGEKLQLKKIMDSGTEIRFIIGCLFGVHTFPEFIDEYAPGLKNVLW